MSLFQASDAIVTRFAPSPTGFLHIGGARTALFNWLFARHHGGRFLLRIEDTDQARSTPEAKQAIIDGLKWLQLDYDGEIIYQSQRSSIHQHAVDTMLRAGTAYRCYATKEELEKFRADNPHTAYQSPWRDVAPSDWPKTGDFVIRLKAPQTGQTIIKDLVQGDVTFDNKTLDDLVLLRSDNTPTYMLAVVVDDHEMGVTHVIRGDDHLTNAARQVAIYNALGWNIPKFAHIPLIHGMDGAKLSKRHGALGVDAYKDMGYLPQGLQNYLARLGWSHGDEEFFTLEQATQWFSLDNVGKAPARLDFAKMTHINAQHIKSVDDTELYEQIKPFVPALANASADETAMFQAALPSLKQRAKLLTDFNDLSAFIFLKKPFEYNEEIQSSLTQDVVNMLSELTVVLKETNNWCSATLEEKLKTFATEKDVKFGKVAQPLRAALTNQPASPGVLDVLTIIGKNETIDRLANLHTIHA